MKQTINHTNVKPKLMKQFWTGSLISKLWRGELSRSGYIAMILAISAIVFGALTFIGILQLGNDYFPPDVIEKLIIIDYAIAFALLGIITKRIVSQWFAYRRGKVGARLGMRMMIAVTLMTFIPAALVTLFSIFFLELSVENWFSQRVKTALDESKAIATAYIEEHQKNIIADVRNIALSLSQSDNYFAGNKKAFEEDFQKLTQEHNILEAIIFDPTRGVAARSGLTFALELEVVSEGNIARAHRGDIVILASESDDRIRALMAMPNFLNSYILVGRYIAPEVLGRIQRTEAAVSQYQRLSIERKNIEYGLSIILGVVVLLVVAGSVWVGLSFANDLTQPISNLTIAASKLRDGDLDVRVTEINSKDEIGDLSHTFNGMIETLAKQRLEIAEALESLKARQHFTQQVLAGVSAGVLGLDADGRIRIYNQASCDLLSIADDRLNNSLLKDILPEAELMMQSCTANNRTVERDILFSNGTKNRTLHIQIAIEEQDEVITGYVMTFDDLTPLIDAQRRAVWSDVAKRIAHEIKNPLTPILLSSERLRRRMLKHINNEKDKQIVETCIDTISRQVRDIGSLVDEFSQFARLPKPILREFNLAEICRQAVFLQSNANFENTTIVYENPQESCLVMGDERQVSQMLINLLKNACEAVSEQRGNANIALPDGLVILRLNAERDAKLDEYGNIVIEIEDNGPGFPEKNRERLFEPYIGERSKGSGIGLAVVKKIISEHDGRIELLDAKLSVKESEPKGGLIRINLPISPRSQAETA